MRWSPRLLVAVIGAFGLLVASCGDDSDSDGTSTASSSTVPSSSTTSPPDASTTSTSSTTSTTTSTTTPSTTSTTTTAAPPTGPIPDDQLPGEPFELTPSEGQVLAVVGVEHDDVLNVRRAPGTNNDVVAELAPIANDFTATSRARQLTQSIWWEVITSDGVYGWVSSRFTAITGPTFDLTSQVVAELGEVPEAATIDALGLAVAEALASEEPPSAITLTVPGAMGGDLGEVIYDVVGIGDDATHALRVHVFGQPLEDDSGFWLMSAEVTDMCQSVRGVSEPSGFCA